MIMVLNVLTLQTFTPFASILNPMCLHNHILYFTAPSSRADEVGNAIHSPVRKMIGPLVVPSFITRAFGLDRPLYHTEPDFSTIEEECYLGKEGNLDECADFDPPSGSLTP
jgi:hypothetical protein